MKADLSELISLLFATKQFMRDKMRKSEKKEQGGSFIQFETLRYVREKGSARMHDVARHFLITPPAATLLVDGLVKQKMLIRAFDAKDRRTVRIKLTDYGKKFIVRSMTRRLGELKRVFGVLSPGEREHLAAILKKITTK